MIFTVFKGDVLAVPGQVFAFHNAVTDGDIFCMPESIFGIKGAVFKNGILNVLEGIFALHAYIRKVQVGRTHHKVFALGLAILHFDTRTDQPNSEKQRHSPPSLHRRIPAGL